MKKCQEHPPKNWKPIVSTAKIKSNMECCCYREYNRLKSNLKVMESTSRNCPGNRPKISKVQVEEQIDCQKENRPKTPNKSKTWLEVLRESPRKDKNNKILEPNDKSMNVPRKYNTAVSNSVEPNENQLRNTDLKHFNSSVGDENFLRNLIEFNRIMQAVFAKTVNSYENIRKKPSDVNRIEINCPKKILRPASGRNLQKVLITENDKYNSQKPCIIPKSPVHEEKKKVDLQVKALIKLLESVQSVAENSEVQRDAIQNLTQLIVQLSNENKMLDKLKEMRIDLESKLASLNTENTYLKKQLQTCEKERDKSNHLLQIKETEIEMLKNQLTTIKQRIARKIDSGINENVNGPSLEFNDLDDTIASVPSNNQSFDVQIRPASSSPTEEVKEKWRDRHIVRFQEDDDSGIQSNPMENNNSKIQNANRVQTLSKLNENVKKTVQNLQADLKLNDVSFNLSDATYKLSLSSLI